MNWISHWKKIGIKVKQILKKQPTGQEETDWKNCPQCKKISYLPDLIQTLTYANVIFILIYLQRCVWIAYLTLLMKL